MKFFKPKARLSDVCQRFYDTVILHPSIPGTDIDLTSGYCESVRVSIIEVDPAFSNVEQEKLVEEMMAIWFEVFGLAWLHEVGDEYAAEQSAYTKDYLERENRPDIWEAMGEYNQAIVLSACYGLKPPSTVRLDQEKLDKFKLWHKQRGIDATCVARAANRLGTKRSWADDTTRSFLALKLFDRVCYDPNDEAMFQLKAVIFGFYNGAKEFLSEVRITM